MESAAKSSILVKGFRNELELLSRHVRMLQFVQKHGPIGIIKLSTQLGVARHKVRYSLRILEKEGYIQPSTRGAMTTDKVNTFFEQVGALLSDVVKELDALRSGLPPGQT